MLTHDTLQQIRRVAAPLLLAAACLPLPGCSNGPAPQGIDPIVERFGTGSLKARQPGNQALLDSCVEVKDICDLLLNEKGVSANSTLKTLAQASDRILNLKDDSGDFTDQALLDNSYRSLQEVAYVVRSDIGVLRPTSGALTRQDENFQRVLTLRSNMDLMINSFAQRSVKE